MVHKKQLSYTKRLAANKIIDLLRAGKLSEARKQVRAFYKKDSELYYFFSGWIHQAEARHDLAIKMFERALIANPINEDVLLGLAASYLELGDYATAEECANHALTINNKNPKNLLTLATIISKSSPTNKKVQLQADSLFERAFDQCLTSESSNELIVDILAGWGGCLLNLEELEQAKIILEQAVSYNEYNTIAHKNLTSVYANMNLIDKAINSSKIAQMSDDKSMVIDAIYQEGMLELLKGNYAKGWRLHEARLETHKYAYKDLLQKSTSTFSELTEHNSLLIFQEQGLGDLLHFAHLIPEVYKRCSNIDLVVLPNTFLPMIEGKVQSPKEFILHNFSNYIRNIYIRGVDTIPNEYDCAMSIMSLGHWLKVRPESFNILPFTTSVTTDRYKDCVGIFWKGSVHHANDSLRSVPTSLINEIILKNKNISFVSLQIDRDEDLVAADNLVKAKEDLSGLLNTAAILNNCTLVITVDSMIAHLAAGLGKPVLMLHAWSPDWRWGLTGVKNRWYNTVTDVRQQSYKDWDSVFTEINERLSVLKMCVD
jgi:tetratricopeptide (TPR) repeat protein